MFNAVLRSLQENITREANVTLSSIHDMVGLATTFNETPTNQPDHTDKMKTVMEELKEDEMFERQCHTNCEITTSSYHLLEFRHLCTPKSPQVFQILCKVFPTIS